VVSLSAHISVDHATDKCRGVVYTDERTISVGVVYTHERRISVGVVYTDERRISVGVVYTHEVYTVTCDSEMWT